MARQKIAIMPHARPRYPSHTLMATSDDGILESVAALANTHRRKRCKPAGTVGNRLDVQSSMATSWAGDGCVFPDPAIYRVHSTALHSQRMIGTGHMRALFSIDRNAKHLENPTRRAAFTFPAAVAPRSAHNGYFWPTINSTVDGCSAVCVGSLCALVRAERRY